MPLTEFRKKIEALSRFDITTELTRIINENAELIVNLLREQLATGTDADNKPILLVRRGGEFPFYSDSTVFNKERRGYGLGRETGVITHYMTGQFYASIYLFTTGTQFIFDSGVPYFTDMIAHTTNKGKMMELNKENLEILRDRIILPQLREAWLLRSTQ